MSDYLGLVARLAESGDLPAVWRPAFESVPRPVFVPDVIWMRRDGGLVAVDRADEPDTWASQVFEDEFVVTQVDDGAVSPGQPGDVPTSSTSMPSIVAMMLDRLDVSDGQRVLEIGTGTGWNAGLLAARLGDDKVVSIEVDPVLADSARSALKRAGRHSTIITGDGADGHRAGAPFDRVIATCSVERVPYPWVAQTQPAGRILTPWGNEYHNGALLSLTVADDGTAAGWFDGNVAFMSLRSQREPDCDLAEIGPASASTTDVDIAEVLAFDGSFAIGQRVAGCHNYREFDDAGEYIHLVHFHDQESGSWATVEVDIEFPFPVRQYGPRKLWDEVEAAYHWWVEHDRPEHTRFGMTVTPDRQWTWLDGPGHMMGRG